jgi:uncharacterized protein
MRTAARYRRRHQTIVPTASFRFYGALNDFLPPASRQATLVASFTSEAAIKDLVEALGVPHPEVDWLIVNGRPVTFRYLVQDGDRVAAYPPFRELEMGDAGRLAPPAQGIPRFIADVHLGRLTAYLRLAGIDTAYSNDSPDHELVAISAADDRTLLTRDVGLLKHGAVTRGYFVRGIHPARQLVEVLRQFDLVGRAAPFTRCPRCNHVLQAVAKDVVAHLLPERTREFYSDFARCADCGRIYWEGSHHFRINALLEAAFARAAGREP